MISDEGDTDNELSHEQEVSHRRHVNRTPFAPRVRRHRRSIEDNAEEFYQFLGDLDEHGLFHKEWAEYALARNPGCKANKAAKWFMNHISTPRASPKGHSRAMFLKEVRAFMNKPEDERRNTAAAIKRRYGI